MSIVEEIHKIDNSVVVLQTKVEGLEKKVDDLVTRAEFTPVKMIAYGLATAVGTSVMMALLAKVVISQ